MISLPERENDVSGVDALGFAEAYEGTQPFVLADVNLGRFYNQVCDATFIDLEHIMIMLWYLIGYCP